MLFMCFMRYFSAEKRECGMCGTHLPARFSQFLCHGLNDVRIGGGG
jgi:hypothetical protein